MHTQARAHTHTTLTIGNFLLASSGLSQVFSPTLPFTGAISSYTHNHLAQGGTTIQQKGKEEAEWSAIFPNCYLKETIKRMKQIKLAKKQEHPNELAKIINLENQLLNLHTCSFSQFFVYAYEMQPIPIEMAGTKVFSFGRQVIRNWS